MAVNGLAPITPAITPSAQTPATGATRAGRDDFREALAGLRETGGPTGGTAVTPLKFSNHAIERMQLRGIRFDPTQLRKIDEAVQKAADKGARNTLLLAENSAMIVSVKDRTVVTVLDRAGMKDNVFTNIDSTVMI